jgi:CheY-like chemotaxis protein/anti-sigma regulatory factor (Ser/Thr protein kinase)
VEPLEKFVAMLGHELRNPLAAIVAALHVLRERDGGLQRETSIIERQTQHLIRLVTDLLDVSRITTGTFQLDRQPTNLETAIAHAVETERLAQVLANVLVNAAIYTPRGGRVGLVALRDGRDVRITIRDTGIGITAAQLPSVFEAFFQGRKSPDRAEAGLGIGLSIARSIVTLHAGTIEARSEGAGMGTEVTIRWPAHGGRASRPLRVLVVDDRDGAHEQFAEMLRELGHEPHVVSDGETARAVIERANPHVALVHLGLRSIDCYELVQTLRTIPRAVPTTFVGLTSEDAPADAERSRTAGITRSVARPIDLASLRVALDDVDGSNEL